MNLAEKLQSVRQLRFFRYAVAAGTATFVDVLCFVFFYQTLLIESDSTRKWAALTASYTIGVLTNFLITKYYVFTESSLSTQTQLFRFILVAIVVFFANKYFMDFLFYQYPKFIPYPAIDSTLADIEVKHEELFRENTKTSIEIGKEIGDLRTAKKFIESGVEIAEVSRITGIPIEKLKEIIKS